MAAKPGGEPVSRQPCNIGKSILHRLTETTRRRIRTKSKSLAIFRRKEAPVTSMVRAAAARYLYRKRLGFLACTTLSTRTTRARLNVSYPGDPSSHVVAQPAGAGIGNLHDLLQQLCFNGAGVHR